MKKLTNLILAIIFVSTMGYSQADPGINVNMVPPSLSLYTNGILEVDACNFGATQIVSNSLRITVSVGPNAEIIGVQGGSDPRFTILSLVPGAGNTIIMTNTGAAPITFLDCADINLIIKGKVVSSAATITGTVGYITGTNPLLGGAQNSSQGNVSTGNDNSTTSLTVTPFLPILLESFEAKLVNCKTELNWKTSAEENLKNYELQMSLDGNNFTNIGTVAGKGKHGNGSSYTYTHESVNGTIYYRLKSLDNNGSFSFSNVVNIRKDCGKRSVNIYPNPASVNLVVNIENAIIDNESSETGLLYNYDGKEVGKFIFHNGANTVDVSKFISGIYMLKIISKDGNENFPVIIK